MRAFLAALETWPLMKQGVELLSPLRIRPVSAILTKRSVVPDNY